MPWDVLALIPVQHLPPPGRTWRCSENFTLDPPQPMKLLRWIIVEEMQLEARFQVALDIGGYLDPTILTKLQHGSTTVMLRGMHIYIGGISWASGPFSMRIDGFDPTEGRP